MGSGHPDFVELCIFDHFGRPYFKVLAIPHGKTIQHIVSFLAAVNISNIFFF